MLLSEPSLGFSKRNSFAALALLHAAANCSNRLGTLQPVQHLLVAPRVLDDKFGPAVDSKHERSLLFLQPAHVVFDVALELRHGANVPQVDHKTSIMLKADNSTL